MTWSILLLLMLQQPAAQAPPADEAEAPEAPKPVYTEGPMQGAVIAMYDARYWYMEEMPGARQPELRMQLRVSGAGIDKTARVGTVIFTEAVDDTGKALIGPDTYTEEQRTETRPFNFTPERVRDNGVLMGARLESPNRGAKSMKLRGSVRLILAPDKEEITIENPLQYAGKTVANDRLKELGIEVRVVPAEEMESETLPPAGQMLTLQYVSGGERVHGVGLFDAWMKTIRVRERPMKTKTGDAVVACQVSGGTIDKDSQLVLTVFPTIDDVQVPIEIDELKLP